MPLQYVLFESSSGYALFERTETEEVADLLDEVQKNQTDFSLFSKLVKLKGFAPFLSAESALENLNDVTEGIMNGTLKTFLENQSVPTVKPGKKAKFALGVSDPKLGGCVKEELSIECISNETVLEIMRGIRMHIGKFIAGLEEGDVEKAQVGLGHSYSRSKVKFNIHRSDNMIIQAIAILDQIDKDINTFAMRVKEWYGWHFPELAKLIPEVKTYVSLVNHIKSKSNLKDEANYDGIVEVLDRDEDLAKSVIQASKISMGAELSAVDMVNVSSFASRVVSLVEYRQKLTEYLQNRMNAVAPNLTALIGETVGARLISKAGSLTNLAKAPASTVQILGAEKALFRALKTKGNTPKYGLIYHSSFIGRASAKNKGRISRYLANKCSISSRIDCFSDEVTDEFGKKMREQVEERLEFFDSGKVPRKNVDVMKEVMDLVAGSNGTTGEADGTKEEEKKKKKKKKKRKADDAEGETPADEEKPKKKKKKDKAGDEPMEEEKKRKKKRKKSKDADGKKKKKKKKQKD